ncbi:hypothetical protein VTJ49DRAFT_773 [Mycothermus thermophilus]|uniref:Uncharacterized protein n=1 Tax=Humicola insolens TaxID=85995 RepID=A0ABR3VE81_HUMIN
MAPSSHRGSPSRPLPSISDNSNDLDLSPQRVRFAEGEPQTSYRIPQRSPPAAAIGVAITTPDRNSFGPSVYWDDRVSGKDIDRESDANLVGYTFFRDPTPPPPGEEILEKETGYGAVRGGAVAGGGGGGLAAPAEPSSAAGGGGGGGGGAAGSDHNPKSGPTDPTDLGGDWSLHESIGMSPQLKKKLLWATVVLGVLIIVGVVTGVVVGLVGVTERNGGTVGSQNLPTSSLPTSASDLGPSPIDDAIKATGAPAATSTSTDTAAMPTTTTSTPGRPTYNSDCPALNNTIYHVPGSTKSFRRYCGIDYGGGHGATDLAHACRVSPVQPYHTNTRSD